MNTLWIYRKVSGGPVHAQRIRIKAKALNAISQIAYKDFKYKVEKDLLEGTFKRGTFNGDIYTVILEQDDLHKFVYGDISAVFKVDKDKKVYEIIEIEPADFIMSMHMKPFPIYKGMVCRDAKDKFRIDYALTKRQNDNKACKEKNDTKVRHNKKEKSR